MLVPSVQIPEYYKLKKADQRHLFPGVCSWAACETNIQDSNVPAEINSRAIPGETWHPRIFIEVINNMERSRLTVISDPELLPAEEVWSAIPIARYEKLVLTWLGKLKNKVSLTSCSNYLRRLKSAPGRPGWRQSWMHRTITTAVSFDIRHERIRGLSVVESVDMIM